MNTDCSSLQSTTEDNGSESAPSEGRVETLCVLRFEKGRDFKRQALTAFRPDYRPPDNGYAHAYAGYITYDLCARLFTAHRTSQPIGTRLV
jgi:hypothetical protein